MSFGKHFNERKYSDLKNRIEELEKKFKELEVRTNNQTEVLNIPVVSNNEVAVCDCGIPTSDADNECCMICGKLLYGE